MTEEINISRIISNLAEDDEGALEELFNFYYPRLFSFSKSFFKIEDGIDDIIQEVFIKIWRNRKKINSASTFNSFIFTITKNLLLNELRSRLNNENAREKIRNLSIAQEYSSIADIEYDELKTKVDEIIDKLPERQKEVFVLSRAEGLSHKEIAEKLGIKTKTVEYHITQAAGLIKSKLKELGMISLLYFYLFF
ncbi:RNA polymerase sigma-70 factor, ECF subfamily [Mariniphaga anaerophila]|uniref:RNA polymerase sigma factor n=1 Tax=Mariniphaga anaerophila TaxID=1484053 RepID=A0A1M5A881_9BACT|nr:RNA polymerase sigma-70 factor [Mariniphaga anaerophila]SHF26500.1 RNA polymerase sigma-70 factor, ECF subfamily [Mariniphaga anaerophila]